MCDSRCCRTLWMALLACLLTLLLACQGSKETAQEGPCPDGMIEVPGGDFAMGSAEEEGGMDEHPRHEIAVSAFCMDETEVTNSQFKAFVDATGYKTAAEKEEWGWIWSGSRNTWLKHKGANWRFPSGPGTSIEAIMDHPVVQVCREDALAYAKWAGKRLPTEAEWEYAARGGGNLRYSFGDEEDPALANTEESKRGETVSARSGSTNAFGLYNLSGNVMEWCIDYYAEDFYSKSQTTNPFGPDHGLGGVLRGGAWNESMFAARAAARYTLPLDGRNSAAGFRCAKSIDQADQSAGSEPGAAVNAADDTTSFLTPGEEKHLKNVRRLTNEGDNAEAYFSFDNKKLIFQSTRGERNCDQIYTMNLDGSDLKMVSTGKGQTTCAYWTPDGKRIVYASTHLGSPDCLPKADRAKKETWAIHETFDIFSANPDGSDIKRLTDTPGYDAEATVGPHGKIVFTSMRDGDLEVYTMNADGSNQTRLTNRLGYDGGPFFTHDGKQIIWRAYYPETQVEIAEFKEKISRLRTGQWPLGTWIMNADGSGKRRLTPDDHKLYWAPFPHPDGNRVFFTSNMLHDGSPWNFEVYMLHMDSGEMERVTLDESFDAFPMISSDGKKFVWCSNRHGATRYSTNVFVADWVD